MPFLAVGGWREEFVGKPPRAVEGTFSVSDPCGLGRDPRVTQTTEAARSGPALTAVDPRRKWIIWTEGGGVFAKDPWRPRL